MNCIEVMNPKIKNNLRRVAQDILTKNQSWEENPDSFEFLDTLIVLLIMKIVPTGKI